MLFDLKLITLSEDLLYLSNSYVHISLLVLTFSWREDYVIFIYM